MYRLAAALLLASPAVAWADTPLSVVTEEIQLTANDFVAHGDDLSDNKRYDDAIDAFNSALQIDPRNAAAFAGRSIAYASTNRLLQAQHDVDAAARLAGESMLVHRARGLIAMRRSDDKTGIAELSKALEARPDDRFSLYYRAWLYQDAHRDVAALADADTYIVAHPRAAEGYVLRGKLLLAQHKPTLALIEGDRLVRLFPDDSKTLAAAAEIYAQAGDRQRAFEAIDRAIAMEPAISLYRFMRSRFHRWDDFGGKRADLEAALNLNPGNLDAVTQLALVNFKQERWADAISGFSTILQQEPKDFGILAYRAMASEAKGDASKAAQDFATAMSVASGPDDFDKICWAFANEGRALKWALEACNQALASKPNESNYLADRGLVRLRLGQLQQALDDYDRAISSDPTKPFAYYGRGLALLRQGKKESAMQSRQRALELSPHIDEVFDKYGLRDFIDHSKPS